MAYERIFEEKDVGIDLIDNDFTQDHCKFSTPLHEHSSLESGSNPKVKTQPKFQWNLVWPCMLVEKNLSRKNSIGGPSRKFKNLARKRKILKFF